MLIVLTVLFFLQTFAWACDTGGELTKGIIFLNGAPWGFVRKLVIAMLNLLEYFDEDVLHLSVLPEEQIFFLGVFNET